MKGTHMQREMACRFFDVTQLQLFQEARKLFKEVVEYINANGGLWPNTHFKSIAIYMCPKYLKEMILHVP